MRFSKSSSCTCLCVGLINKRSQANSMGARLQQTLLRFHQPCNPLDTQTHKRTHKHTCWCSDRYFILLQSIIADTQLICIYFVKSYLFICLYFHFLNRSEGNVTKVKTESIYNKIEKGQQIIFLLLFKQFCWVITYLCSIQP